MPNSTGAGGSQPLHIPTSKEQALITILKRRHTDYKELNALWTMYQAVYTGGSDILPYLIQHDREHEESFKARKKRAFYFNYVKQIVNLFVSYLYRKEISRSSDIKQVSDFWDNADGSSEGIEHPINNILKEAAVLYLLFGKVAIVVDMPKSDDSVVSEKDRKDQNINPYIYLIKPQNITDWQYGEDGSLLWIRVEESVPVPSDPLSARADAKRFKYTTWTRDQWMTHVIEERGHNSNTRAIISHEQREHGLGRVPVVMVMRNDNFKFGSSSGESLIKDIAISNIALFNLSSITGEEFYNHALNILVMQKRLSDDDDSEIILSDKNVLEFEGTVAPHFLAPSSVPVESLQGFLGKLIEEMKRMSRLGSTDSSLTGTGNQVSGLAHAFSFSDSNQALADTASLFEEVEQRIVTMVALWLDMNPVEKLTETSIDYPEDFGIDLFDDELNTVNTAVESIPSKTFAKVIKKRTAKKFLSKETDEVVEAVEHEIETAIDALTDQPTGESTQPSGASNAEGKSGLSSSGEDGGGSSGESASSQSS